MVIKSATPLTLQRHYLLYALHLTLTLLVCENKESHDSYQNVFENGEVVEDDCHHAQVPQRSLGSEEKGREVGWGGGRVRISNQE